jgi:hypothetical protein
MKPLVRVAALALGTLSASAVSAQVDAPSADAIRQAAEAFDRGREAYKAEEHAEAAEHFETADRHAASNKAVEFAIRSRRKAGQRDRAATLAELAIRRYPQDARLKALADEVLAETAGALHRVVVTCEPACELVVDSSLVHGRPATERVIYVEPGEHQVSASWAKHESVAKVVVGREGGKSELSFTRSAPESDELPPPTPLADGLVDDHDDWDDFGEDKPAGDQGVTQPAGGGLPTAVFWSGVGLTAVGIGASTWSYIDARNNPGEEKIREDCILSDGTSLGKECKTWKQAKLNELRTNIILGSTVAVGVATLIIGAAATDWGPEEPGAVSGQHDAGRNSPSVQPWVEVGRGLVVGAVGRF